MNIQFFPSLGHTRMEFISYAIQRVIFRLVYCAPLTPKFLNAIGVSSSRRLICFEQVSFLLANGFAHFLTCPFTLKLLAHRKLSNYSTNNKQQGHEPEYPDQLFSMCGITLFVFVDPVLPRNFIEFAVVRRR